VSFFIMASLRSRLVDADIIDLPVVSSSIYLILAVTYWMSIPYFHTWRDLSANLR